MNRFTEKFKNLKCLTHFLLPITKCNFRKSKQPELGKSWFWTHILSIMRVFLKKWVLPLSCINWTRTLSEKSKKCKRTILRKCCYRWANRENWIHRTFWQSQLSSNSKGEFHEISIDCSSSWKHFHHQNWFLSGFSLFFSQPLVILTWKSNFGQV